MIDLRIVNSSNIARVGFDSSLSKLIIEFRTGKHYEYENIPETLYNNMLNSQSIGKFFNEFIRGKFPYRELIINKNGDQL